MRKVEAGVGTGTPAPVLPTAAPTMITAVTLASSVTPTPTQVAPTHTPVPLPSNTITPTPRLQTRTVAPRPPLPTAGPPIVRIRFAPGATSATLTGRIVRAVEGGVEFGTEYLIRAFGGQMVSVAITSPNNDVLLTIVGADGVPLKRYVDGTAVWSGQLYATQDYIITPASVGKTTDYALAVSISAVRLLELERIQFGPGAASATVQGDLAPGLVARYVLRALRGRKLGANVVLASSISLAVEGQDGSFWSGPSSEGTLAIDRLPETQDYVITLALAPAAEATHYTLKVTVVAGSGG